jgi:hypothetical protein
MTTLAEITELKTEMDAKFDKVYAELAEIKTELHGQGKDVKGLRADMEGGFQSVNAKMDKLDQNIGRLLEFHGIANGDGNDVHQETA